MRVRRAVPEDAEAVCAVLRRSITELCIADHGGEADVLDGWLRNKTPQTVRGWIAESLLVVADIDGTVAGVAGADETRGEVTLNDVAPDFRFQGVSASLLLAIEAALAVPGRDDVTLTSTETAYRFYSARGYEARGGPLLWRGGRLVHPMIKRLKGA